jgi:hypothetical protein
MGVENAHLFNVNSLHVNVVLVVAVIDLDLAHRLGKLRHCSGHRYGGRGQDLRGDVVNPTPDFLAFFFALLGGGAVPLVSIDGGLEPRVLGISPREPRLALAPRLQLLGLG